MPEIQDYKREIKKKKMTKTFLMSVAVSFSYPVMLSCFLLVYRKIPVVN